MSIIKPHIVEHKGHIYGLGRDIKWDYRNSDHLLPKKSVPRGVRERMWFGGPVLNQGETPMCVGYSGWGWLRGGPDINIPDFTPEQLYHWAQQKDQWDGEDYEGSSTLGLMQVLLDAGYIKGYKWALDTDVLISWILTTGPIIVGTNWYDQMFTPRSKDGFLIVDGEVIGGHEWRILGINLDKKCPDGTKGAGRMVNTWGNSWGQSGRAWISFKDIQRLLSDGGEAVTPTEVVKAKFK